MTDSEPQARPALGPVGTVDADATLPASEAALARYHASMRRKRVVYYAVLAVIVTVVAIGVGVVWSHGETAHVTLRTVGSAPPSVALTAPSAAQQQAWHSADRVALGVPTWNGTVITFSTHSVGGRDVRTGKRTWQYTRTDRAVCTAAQLAGTTIAVYRNDGNCDELSAFDSGTGRRRWTRTLDMDGMPLNGQPTYQVTPFTLLLATHDVVYALDPVSGYNRWTYSRYGCRIQHVVLGTNGALISQNCSAQVRCANVKLCGRGPQLLLRDAQSPRGDDSKPGADQLKWNRIGDTDVPVSADQVISSADPGGAVLHVLDPGNGMTAHAITLHPASAQLEPIAATATSDAELVWIGGRAYALSADSNAVSWSVAIAQPPTVTPTGKQDPPPLAAARISVALLSNITLLDGATGRVAQEFPIAMPAPPNQVFPVGTGFLVAGPGGVTAYR